MATINPSAALAAAQASSIATFISTSPTLKIYSGSMPATPETAVTGTLLATVALSSFTASGAVATSNDPAAVTPSASGTAGYARLIKSDGTTVVCDLDVTATGSGGSVQLASTALSTSVPVDLSPITITFPSV